MSTPAQMFSAVADPAFAAAAGQTTPALRQDASLVERPDADLAKTLFGKQ